MITKAVIQLLLADATIAAILADRVFPSIIKQGVVFPAVYVTSASMERIPCYGTNSVYEGAIEIGVYALRHVQATEIIDQIRAVLDEFDGVSAGVSLSIMSGKESNEQYDEDASAHVKTIEYNAVAQITQ